MCQHLQGSFKLPSASTSIHKEECTLCFDNDQSPDGLNVCLSCFTGGCAKHIRLHACKSGHNIILNIRKEEVQKEAIEPPQKITKVAIGIVGGATQDEQEYIYHTSVRCVSCGFVELDQTSHPSLPEVIRAVTEAPSAAKKEELKAWENQTRPCSHTRDLQQASDASRIGAQGQAHCGNCDLNENLWLCLTCGHLGCGRRNYDGSGGNNHAVEHFSNAGHPLVCKLGTITPEGTADIYCYSCDDSVLDENLVGHLLRLGIDTKTQSKTAKSTAEMELDSNLALDFSVANEGGEILKSVSGPGLTGLKNLGNSCYMASVFQALFALPRFINAYYPSGEHEQICSKDPASCLDCQLRKLADGLLSGRYTPDKMHVTPRMIKTLVGRDHPEFATMRQQDVLEFFQQLVMLIQRSEHAKGNSSDDPSRAFEFSVVSKVQCLQCQKIRISTTTENFVSLPIPFTNETTPVSLRECFSAFTSPDRVDGFRCPQCQQPRTVENTLKFATFPKILVVQMRRFERRNWIPYKLNTDVLINPSDPIDLSSFSGSTTPDGLEEMPREEKTQIQMTSAQEEVFGQLVSMGFSEASSRAASLRASSVEDAMAWALENPNGEVEASAAVVDESSVQMLQGMGFDAEHVRIALKACDGDVNRAVDWLFSHPDPASATAETSTPKTVGDFAEAVPPVYELVAFVTHRGTSVHCGHYVAHIKRNGEWVLFNDDKVATVTAVPASKAYLYFFRRVDQADQPEGASDTNAIDQLMAFGFPREKCEAALAATSGTQFDVEATMNWILEHS
eukprot:TRINITY_DN2503_c0_g1::TRINITY_DN2503_c0_g1_i1::g.19124::m.19124 TRINITY_DN2503_c0_g1::TRINITY_DN2503_c0_g1_i1::g.19124  ORF type:complete len:805 (+),score=50.59,sp/P56399/UBP5_MOUSE/34.24/1e-149,UCH/PF00443.24/2.1e-48,UCH_1/PF13423.1/7.1e+03,UCH_1/PF13423.1/2.6e-25,UBA/PF00627.26/54,UBA/PF00627.26/6.6e-12,UBA/PF00627.26/1.3e-05,zf-UBP/PF02148.14/0.0099,zf-UBP/PF02148.14/1.4e+04,zf-UBP/PF02148.14/2.8e-20,zf-UBP/PF02148.14/1.4e+04,zf-UBP/PF02148.14/5.1e+03,UBA_3/PF09288.5/5.2e+02,UBA_3/PF09288.5/